MTREFRVRREQHLPVAPEQVWHAVATTVGNNGWLYPMDIEPRVGGAVSRGPATVVEWAPPRRFACRFADDKGFSNTLSYTIDAGEPGTSRLFSEIHWVHQGDVDDGWDTRADAAEKHVDFYQHSLDQYLRYFAGRAATYVTAARASAPTSAAAFGAVRRRLGLNDGSAVGSTVRLDPPDGIGGPREAVVDYLSDDFVGLRTTDGLYRFFDGSTWNWPIRVGHHLFVEATAAIDDSVEERSAKAWNAWLEETAS